MYLVSELATGLWSAMCSSAQVAVVVPHRVRSASSLQAGRPATGRASACFDVAEGVAGAADAHTRCATWGLKMKAAGLISTGRQRLVSITGSWRYSPSWFKASCVILTIRPAYPWATTLTWMLGVLRCGPISGARPSIRQIRLTRCARKWILCRGARVVESVLAWRSTRRSIT